MSADNGLHYINYDPDILWQRMMEAYIENGGNALKPGDEKEMLLRTVQAVVVQSQADIDNALRMKTLRYASGEYLDVLAENRGISRDDLKRKKGSTIITNTYKCFGDGRDYTLPEGINVTADGKTIFRTVGEAQCHCHTLSGPVYLEANTDIAPTSIMIGTKLYPVTQADRQWVEFMEVTSTDIVSGMEQVTDEIFREAIMAHMRTNVTTGTIEQIRQACAIEYIKWQGVSEEEVPNIVITGTNDLDVYINSDQYFVAMMTTAYINGQYSLPIGMTIAFHQMQSVDVSIMPYFYTTRYNAAGQVIAGGTWYHWQLLERNNYEAYKELIKWMNETSSYGRSLNFADLLTRMISVTSGAEYRVTGVQTSSQGIGFIIDGVQQSQVSIGGNTAQAGQLIYFPEENSYYKIRLYDA